MLTKEFVPLLLAVCDKVFQELYEPVADFFSEGKFSSKYGKAQEYTGPSWPRRHKHYEPGYNDRKANHKD